MSEAGETTMVPAIRFEGFDDSWDNKALGEVIDLENGFAFKSQNFESFATNVVVLTPGSVFVGGGFQSGKEQYYKTSLEVSSRFKFKHGDMFITMTDLTPTAQALGFPAIVPEDNNTYLHNQRLGKIVGFRGNNDFLFQLLRTEDVHTKTVQTASGTTVKHTSPEKFLSVKCHFPDVDEQTKIGEYFQQLDALIAGHRGKREKLIRLKKSLLEKVFPKQGQEKPEIRFAEFAEDWRETNLGLQADIVRGASPRPIENPKWFDGKSNVGWLRIKDVSNQNGKIFHLEQRLSKEGEEKTRVITEPHLLLSIAASVGKPVINYVSTGVHDGFLIFRKPSFDLEFMFQWLKSFESNWQQYGQPGSQINLNSEIVRKQILFIPKTKEQTKIGQLFKHTDTLIDLHQTQINKLLNIKQACLAKMFV
jgi:type I restriction enzyme S subunit